MLTVRQWVCGERRIDANGLHPPAIDGYPIAVSIDLDAARCCGHSERWKNHIGAALSAACERKERSGPKDEPLYTPTIFWGHQDGPPGGAAGKGVPATLEPSQSSP